MMKMSYRITSILAFGFAIAAWGQQSAPPRHNLPTAAPPWRNHAIHPGKVDPTGSGRVGGNPQQSGLTLRKFVEISDVMADPEACTLYTTETVSSTSIYPKEKS